MCSCATSRLCLFPPCPPRAQPNWLTTIQTAKVCLRGVREPWCFPAHAGMRHMHWRVKVILKVFLRSLYNYTVITKRSKCCLSWHFVMSPSLLPPMSLRLCSSTHPLTSQANCPTRLSVRWCKREGATNIHFPRREETRRWGKEEYSSLSKPKLLLDRLHIEILRKLLAEEVAEKHWTCTFLKVRITCH